MSRHRVSRRAERDEGSVLIMALVMMVIGSMIVLSVLTYSITVMRANHVLTEKTQRLEAVKAGLRVSLSDPVDLYEYCANTGATVSEELASFDFNGVHVSSRCYTVGVAAAQDEDEKRFGLVSTQVGQAIPEELSPANPDAAMPVYLPTRYTLADPTSDPHAWVADSTEASLTGFVWRPRLPTHTLNLRSPSGTAMQAGWDECRVYFPGTYLNEIVLDGPTFFTSGIYYFENTITVVGGADVVVGDGATEGCVSSQDALFYAENVPGSHNVDGYGATWVFGDKARLVVTNDPDRDGSPGGPVQPISFTINRRYNSPGDYAAGPSSDVAIITVDGELDVTDPANPVGIDLDAPGRIFVPQSIVGHDDPSTPEVEGGSPATTKAYTPSVFTPKPKVPDMPEPPTASRRSNGRAILTWEPPEFDGGAPITQYLVAASQAVSGTGTCVTHGALTCAIEGLPTNSNVTFTVTATNEVGDSITSGISNSIRADGGGNLNAPSGLAAPVVDMQYDPDVLASSPGISGIAHVTFSPPTSDGGAPITSYQVSMTPLLGTPVQCAEIDMTESWTPAGEATPYTPELSCDFTGLDPRETYTFDVTATNVRGNTVSLPTVVPGIVVLDLSIPFNGTDDEVATMLTSSWTVHAEHAPAPERTGQPPVPVVEFDLGFDDDGDIDTAPVEIDIPGYTSIAQGRLLVDNPLGYDVSVMGGVIAAQYDIDDGRNTGPGTVSIGYVGIEVQRRLKIVTTNSGGAERSTAIVQVNQNGAYAVNSWEVQ